MHMANGLAWSIPVTLPVADDVAAGLREGQEIALVDGDHLMGIMTIEEKFLGRQGARGARGVQDDRPGPSRRGPAVPLRAIRCWAARCSWSTVPRRPSSPSCGTSRPRRGGCSPRGVGGGSSPSRRATRSTAPTSTSRRWRWRSSTGCSCTRWWARPRPTTSRPTCGSPATRPSCATTTRPTGCCWASFRRRCATPGRARRSFTPSPARTMAAPTLSSAATTPAWATIMAPTTPTISLTSSSRASWASSPSSSTTPSTAKSARRWSAPRPALTAKRTGSS